jgi:hypothetical protein
MRSPKQTIDYLRELQTLGFTDEAFSRTHHFREKETINGHISYCENIKTDSFRDGGNNERVQLRLGIILKCFRDYHQGNSAMFPQLAEAAYVLIPLE